MFTLSNFNFDWIRPRAFVSFRKNHGQLHRLMHGWAPFRHSNDVLFQHILPIFLKERVAAAHRGQRFQEVQKWVQDLMNPDIVWHFVDPTRRGQQGATWKSRSEGCNRDFLTLGRWRSRGTAGTSGSAVGFCCHLFEERRSKNVQSGGLCRWPPNTFWMEMDNDGRRIDAEFYGNSTRHYSNTLYHPGQGHWQCPHNPQHHLLCFFRSFTIVSHQSCPESNTKFI